MQKRNKKLKKGLGFLATFAVAAGAMISSGLFILPGIAFARAGPAIIFSYIIAGILALPAILSKAELITAMPRSGGDYFYITRSMGFSIGTIAGFSSWLSLSLKSAFALVGMGIFARLIWPELGIAEVKIIAIIFCILFMVINILGIKQAGRLQIFLVFFLFLILGLYIVRGFTEIDPHRFVPFMPNRMVSVLTTAGLVFISFGGLTKIASISEEIKNPKLNVPLGMFVAYLTVLALYTGVAFITVGIVEPNILKNSLTPISDGAKTFGGMLGVVITGIAAILAFISTANAGIMSASRYPLAMSRDGLLPRSIGRVHKKYKTPYVSIILTTLIMIVIIIFLNLKVLVEAASTILLLLFIFANLSVIVMRESKLQNYQPIFRSPLYPFIQIIGIIGYGLLIYNMGKDTLIITAIFIIFSLIWFLIFGRARIKMESALMYVVERITDRQIVTDTLSDELRQIIIERDEIIQDEIDRLIKNAVILNFPEAMEFDEFVQIAADKLSKRLKIKPEKLVKLFIEREKQSCTALRPGLAIPHIIIKGKNKFDILLVRAKKGIKFPCAKTPVQIVFVLVGTQDMRNLHLRTLMAIAQLTQQHNFDKQWLNAQDKDDLRDILLLGKRKRH